MVLLYQGAQHWAQHPRCHQNLAKEKDYLPQPLYTPPGPLTRICKEDKGMGTFMGSPRRERATPAHMATFPATFPGTVAEHTHHTKMHQHVCREALKAEEEEEGPSV